MSHRKSRLGILEQDGKNDENRNGDKARTVALH